MVAQMNTQEATTMDLQDGMVCANGHAAHEMYAAALAEVPPPLRWRVFAIQRTTCPLCDAAILVPVALLNKMTTEVQR
jgi:hypothetical protein